MIIKNKDWTIEATPKELRELFREGKTVTTTKKRKYVRTGKYKKKLSQDTLDEMFALARERMEAYGESKFTALKKAFKVDNPSGHLYTSFARFLKQKGAKR